MKLTVAESYIEDDGRGIARIDKPIINKLGCKVGEVIEIMAQRSTVAKCLPLNDDDGGKNVIRIDALTRVSAGLVTSGKHSSLGQITYEAGPERSYIITKTPLSIGIAYL